MIRRPVVYGCAFLLAATIEVASTYFVSNLGSPLALILIMSAGVLAFVGMGILIVAGYSLPPRLVAEKASFLPIAAIPLLPESDENQPDTEVSIQFNPSKVNIAEANQATVRYYSPSKHAIAAPNISPQQRLRNGIFGWVVFIGLAVMLVMLVQNSRRLRPTSSAKPAPVQTLATRTAQFLAFGLGAVGIISFAAGLRLLKRSSHPSRLIDVHFSSAAVVYSWPGYRESLSWACFEGMSDTPTLVVLHQHKTLCRFFPKSAFGSLEGPQCLYRIAAKNLPQLAKPAPPAATP